MARGILLGTRTANFLDLVGNGRVYRVPPYQRDYSWEEEQWEDLWSDLVELRRTTDNHYMGALVVEAKSDREFVIIDGQQRFATLSILVLAVIGKLRRMAENGIEGEQNRERAEAVRARFIGEKDPASLVEISKLFLNQTDDPFYQDYLVQLREPRNPRGLPASNRLMWGCFRYFSSRLDSEDAYARDGEALAQLVTETVGRQLLFILIDVDDDLSAYTVFETLNARGIELSTTDLLKNYLFSRVRVGADLDALQRRWGALVATVKQERFPEFLRYHLLCEIPRIRSQRLFKLVREQVKTPQHVFALMDALEGRAELFTALSDPVHAYWAERPDCKPHVRALQLFRVKQMTPLLFAAWERLQKDFARVLRLVSVLSFRYSVIGGLNPNALEGAYHEAAKAVLLGGASSPREIFERLGSIVVADDKFEEDFTRFSVRTSGQSKRLARYILSRLEQDTSGHEVDPDTDSATIEHILPENPGVEWETTFKPEHWELATYRLGNLTLLEPSLNRAIGNGTYDAKVAHYSKSKYGLTRSVVDLAPAEWTLAHLEKRQAQLAGRAVHVWRCDFS